MRSSTHEIAADNSGQTTLVRNWTRGSGSVSLSIIIVTYNGWHHLEPCLHSLMPQLETNDEIVVVDNGSSDSTQEGIATIADPRIRCCSQSKNLGFAAANNIGATNSSRDWILLLNNDTIATAGFIDGLRDAASRYSEYKIFSCKMIRMSDRRIDNVGIAVTSPLLRQVQLGPGSDPQAYTESMEVFGASGGAMLVHRSVIQDIGLFDFRFFAYCEDVEFALRARLAGYRCRFVPNASVLHTQCATGSQMPGLRLYYIQRNMELALFRNLPLRELIRYAAPHFIYSSFQVFRWMLRGQGIRALRAKIDALRMWRLMRASRGPMRITRRTFHNELRGIFTGSADMHHISEQTVQEEAVG